MSGLKGASQNGKGQRRRTASEVQELLISAAQETFASEGYGGATTREIAVRAGVSDVLIYRHFGSKRGLFEKSVLEPIQQFMSDYFRVWSEYEAGSVPMESLVHRYVAGLYPILRRNRSLILALISADEFENEIADGGSRSRFSSLLDPIVEAVRGENRQRPLFDTDEELTARVAFSVILGAVLLEDHVFPRKPNSTRLMRELERFVHHRVMFRPDAG